MPSARAALIRSSRRQGMNFPQVPPVFPFTTMRRSQLFLALVLASFSPAAAFSTFNFSFSNVDGAVSGLVTGTITLPDGDGTFPALGVEVTSAPGLLGLTLPLDAMASGSLINLFVVVDGQVDLANSMFLAQFATGTSLGIQGGPGAESFLDLAGADDLGVSGVLDAGSSTLVINPVPEASTVVAAGLLGSATVGFASWRCRRNRGM